MATAPTDLKGYAAANPDLTDFYKKWAAAAPGTDYSIFAGKTYDKQSLDDFLKLHGETYGWRDYKAPVPAPAPAAGGGGGSAWGGYAQKVDALLAGFQNPIGAESLALAKEQIEYTSRRLTEIEEARRLTDMTGTLTSAELKMFDEMEASAVDNLKSQVNAQTEDVWNTALADLVNRGVLQGTVGQKILGTISSENVRTIAEGINTIRGQKNVGQLNVMEGNKNRALQTQNMLTQESMGLLGVGQGYATADLQAQLQKLGLGVGANVQFAGFTSNEDIAAQQRALQDALAQLQAKTMLAGYKTQWDIAGLDAKTRLTIAGMMSAAAGDASKWGAYGNITAAGIAALTAYLSSDGFRKLLAGDGKTAIT